jgi:hypothetical protein
MDKQAREIAKLENQIPQEYSFGVALRVLLVDVSPYPSKEKAERTADRIYRVYSFPPTVQAVMLSPEDLKAAIERRRSDRQERIALGGY